MKLISKVTYSASNSQKSLTVQAKLFLPLFVFLLIPIQTVIAVTSPTPTKQLPTSVLTVTPTKTVTSTPTPIESVSNDIKEKVKERIDSIKETGKKKAFWGTLKNRSNAVLVIDAPTGEKRIKTDETTTFVGAGKKLVKIDDLEIGNFIIALGYGQENGTLTAKRITALTNPPKPAPKRNAVYGNVSSINKTKKSLEINSINSEAARPKTILISTSTIIIKNSGGKISKGAFETINKGDLILSICTPKEGDDTTCTGKIIYITPSENQNKSTPTPTKKLSSTPTPKAVKTSPTPTE